MQLRRAHNTEVQMNEKFFDLAREKQDRMINGAIEVFAKNGYKHASTDDMVKTVGVSKGLWFQLIFTILVPKRASTFSYMITVSNICC